ncbi:MAG: DnaB-like helicase C-terminal domain-containing protein [Prevotella sp.]|nr:DnaB-like helicase C-terminal domain-containing protein [Prevotella sp.]
MNEIKSDKSYINMREMLKDCLSDVQARAAKIGVPGIPTGFQSLDDLTEGFEKGKLYVIGGRPCMGKEEFMLSMIIDIIMQSKLPVLLFSTNHQKADYVQRLLAIHCDIPVMHLSQGFLEIHEWEKLDQRVGDLADAPLFLHDSLDLPLNELVETAQNSIREKDVHIIFIDCLQMIDFVKEDDTPSDRVAKVMLSLKQLARITNVPIIIGSMLGRGIEYREGLEGKRPQLMDLMNSSYIEGLADVIMMVHRPEYYHIYQDDNGRDLHGRIEIIVKKNALKPLNTIFLDYHEETGVVSVRKNTSNNKLNTVCLKELSSGNEAVKKLIKAFDLEEELPF